jgi:nucleotide-binding universal stress UspA family protein
MTCGWRTLHPTDFSEASEVAFLHALQLTLATRGRLQVLHVSRHGERVGWRSFPGVREALEHWGVLPSGSPPQAVADLGIDIAKVEAVGDDPVLVVHEFLQSHPADLIVLATHQRDALARWRQPSVATQIAQQAHQVTLFVPDGTVGFVDALTGRMRLERILIPVDHVPAPQPAIGAAAALAGAAARTPTTFRLVHVGGAEFPTVDTHDRPGWTWQRRVLTGNPATALVHAAHDFDADLVVMPTAGRHGFVDALRGSTTERVLRGLACPLLAVAISSRLGHLAWR